MKRSISIILVVIVAMFALAGCRRKKAEPTTMPTTMPTTAATTAPTTAPTTRPTTATTAPTTAPSMPAEDGNMDGITGDTQETAETGDASRRRSMPRGF